MKKVFYSMLLLLCLGAASVNAQVAIGTQTSPHKAAVLDLQSSTKGLKLPAVSLSDLKVFGLGSGLTTEEITAAVGMVVFNTNVSTGVGIYVWNGTEWLAL